MGWLILLGIVLLIAIALFMSVSVSVFIDEEIDVKISYAGITLFKIDSTEDPEKAKKKKAKKEAKKKKKEEKKKLKEEKKRLKAEKKKKKSGQAVTDASDNTQSDTSADETQQTDNEKKKKTPEEKQREKEEKRREKAAKKKKLEETIDLVKLLVKSAGKPVKRLISHIRINDFCIDITASGEDAAKAALNYGKINIAVNSLLTFLYQFVKLRVKKVNIGVDFESGETKFALYCKVKMRISTALGCGIWFLFRMLKLSLKKNNQKEENNQNTTDGKPSVNKKGK